jgi:hypothetical protein
MERNSSKRSDGQCTGQSCFSGSLRCSQEPTTGSYPEPVQFTPYSHTISLGFAYFNIILPTAFISSKFSSFKLLVLKFCMFHALVRPFNSPAFDPIEL